MPAQPQQIQQVYLPATPHPVAKTKQKNNNLNFADYSLATYTVTSRALDYLSTRHCVTTLAQPIAPCQEEELPQNLVKSQPMFISFELATSMIAITSEYTLVKHGHAKLGRMLELITASETTGVALHNYSYKEEK